MRSSIQLGTLNYALVVAEGSFLRAAGRADIDHSALSRRIRDLEYAMGTRIFHRHPRGVGPTPAGERFLDRLRSVPLDLDNTLTEPALRMNNKGFPSAPTDSPSPRERWMR